MSFSVCVVCKENPDIVQQFVAYYRRHGAVEILVYLDEGAPDPDLPETAGIKAVPCADLLAALDVPARPKFVADFQQLAYRHAYQTFSSQWLLICDVDEFVHASSQSTIQAELDKLPDDWHFVRLPVAEAVWGPQDEKFTAFGCTYFRTCAPKGLGKLMSLLLYGRNWQFTIAGLVGHSVGKYFIRSGAPVTSLGLHEPEGTDLLRGDWAYMVNSPLILHHFDAISFERWHEKWDGRLNGHRASNTFNFNPASQRYITRFAATPTKEKKCEFFGALYGINGYQATLLKLCGQLRRQELFTDTPEEKT